MRHVKIYFLLMASTCFLSCKKNSRTQFEQYFEDQILNKNFVITQAKDGNDDLTGLYNGYVFILKKGSDYYHGPLIVKEGSNTFQGSWSSNEDYGKLVIQLPASPSEFHFLTREWRFASKQIPVLKFAPWGGDDSIALVMQRK